MLVFHLLQTLLNAYASWSFIILLTLILKKKCILLFWGINGCTAKYPKIQWNISHSDWWRVSYWPEIGFLESWRNLQKNVLCVKKRASWTLLNKPFLHYFGSKMSTYLLKNQISGITISKIKSITRPILFVLHDIFKVQRILQENIFLNIPKKKLQ